MWFRILPISGCSVTMPYKTSLDNYLDNQSGPYSPHSPHSPRNLEAPINTIKNSNNNLFGINTDGDATVELLLAEDEASNNSKVSYDDIKNKKILILGAGGAAQATGHSRNPRARRGRRWGWGCDYLPGPRLAFLPASMGAMAACEIRFLSHAVPYLCGMRCDRYQNH